MKIKLSVIGYWLIACALAQAQLSITPGATIITKFKPTTTTRTTTTTLADDPDLVIPVLNGETWTFNFTIRVRINGASSGVKFGFGFPTIGFANGRASLCGNWNDHGSGATLQYSVPYLNSSGGVIGARDGGTTDLTISGTTTVKFSAAGNFSFQWAQNTSSATGTDVLDASSIIAIKMQ